MPQVFQVLRCYKCSIFQVHQTKKDNKWVCKVCGEKQSLKRHYGIGTAKDCRIHVQKLNNIRGDKDESILKFIDSDDSQDENNTENVNINPNHNNVQDNDNIIKQSKWSAYVENKELTEVNEPVYSNNKEVVLELPQKRKINKKSKLFKVPKLSSECNNSEMTSSSDEPTNFKQDITSTHLFNSNTVMNQFVLRKEKNFEPEINNLGKNENIQSVNNGSKWAHFMELNDNFENESMGNNDEAEEYTEENSGSYDDRTYEENQYKCYNNSDCQIVLQNINKKSLFSLCDDDDDLDNILNF